MFCGGYDSLVTSLSEQPGDLVTRGGLRFVIDWNLEDAVVKLNGFQE